MDACNEEREREIGAGVSEQEDDSEQVCMLLNLQTRRVFEDAASTQVL